MTRMKRASKDGTLEYWWEGEDGVWPALDAEAPCVVMPDGVSRRVTSHPTMTPHLVTVRPDGETLRFVS